MHALEIRDLTKTYRSGIRALDGINLTVDEGEFFALLGPNGAGKSTTLGIISSLVNKTSGAVKIFGIDIDRDFAKAKFHIGLVPQELNFSQFESVYEIVLNQAGYYGIPRRAARENTDRYLNQLGLWDKREQPSRALSGGMKRRLMIARALVHEPKLLILDEPTAGVDVALRRSMWDFLRELNAAGTTIILTTHYLEEAEKLCRNIAIINQGKIIENTSMKALLAKLHAEIFVLDLVKPLAKAPMGSAFEFHLTDQTTLEVMVYNDQIVNDLYQFLSAHSIQVSSMRGKANRLEELFVNLVQNDA
ncbi:MAG: ABC transporter ATP-binding protein [Proteobacteria bacterium]|nr:MAG: ABC transporter ATP-binding protein [Pseudomonadota bacterium]